MDNISVTILKDKENEQFCFYLDKFQESSKEKFGLTALPVQFKMVALFKNNGQGCFSLSKVKMQELANELCSLGFKLEKKQ